MCRAVAADERKVAFELEGRRAVSGAPRFLSLLLLFLRLVGASALLPGDEQVPGRGVVRGRVVDEGGRAQRVPAARTAREWRGGSCELSAARRSPFQH